MKKKIIIILMIILAILISGIYFIENNHNNVKIGNTTFTLPNGYHIGKPNYMNDTNITNGTTTLFIAKYNSNDIYKIMHNYKTYKETNKSDTVQFDNMKVKNITVFKSTVNNQTNNTHYWFLKDKYAYTIYSWDETKNLDEIVSQIIESAK